MCKISGEAQRLQCKVYIKKRTASNNLQWRLVNYPLYPAAHDVS